MQTHKYADVICFWSLRSTPRKMLIQSTNDVFSYKNVFLFQRKEKKKKYIFTQTRDLFAPVCPNNLSSMISFLFHFSIYIVLVT